MESLLASGVFAWLLVAVVVLAVVAGVLRESWLGADGTNDPVVSLRLAEKRGRRWSLRTARTIVTVLLAVCVTTLLVTTAMRFAMLSDQPPPPGVTQQ
ncbi:hypothetical protein ACFWNN_03645 [Lentzea sp. NPDC058450]|uniref:hypothetical protein n=1 Tax=Lentzea sp. NPDC058450 TaxID=3346505 RepID=UPI00364DDFD8